MRPSKPRTKFHSCGVVYRQLLTDLLTNRIHDGDDAAKLESLVAKHFGSRFAVTIPMARVGIYLCLRYFLKPKQSVLQSPYTLAEVVNR